MKRKDEITVTLPADMWVAILTLTGGYNAERKELLIHNSPDRMYGLCKSEVRDIMRGASSPYEILLNEVFGNQACEDDNMFEPDTLSTQGEAQRWAERNPDAIVTISSCGDVSLAKDFSFYRDLSWYKVLTTLSGNEQVWTPLTEIEVV